MSSCFKLKKNKRKKVHTEKIENVIEDKPVLQVPIITVVPMITNVPLIMDVEKDIVEKSFNCGDEITIGYEYLHGYKIVKKLHCSNNKQAYIVENKKAQRYILKIKDELSKYEYDIYNILTKATHPNIQQVIILYKSLGKYCFIYEYIEGYDLYEYILRIDDFTEKQIKHIIREVICGLKFLHQNNIVHVDIKEENILFNPDTNVVKIIDFDLSVIIHPKTKHKKHTISGTPQYVAPETVIYGSYSPKSDVWQLGVLLYVLVTNMFPCEDVLNHTCSQLCKDNMYKLLYDVIQIRNMNMSLYTLLENMLDYNEYGRYTLDNILESEWMKI